GERFPGWEFLIPLVKPLGASVFEHLHDRIFVIDEPTAVENSLTELYDHLDNNFAAIAESGDVGLDPKELFLTPEELRAKFDIQPRLELRALGRTAGATDEAFSIPDSDTSSNQSSALFMFPTAAKAIEIEIQS